MSKRFMSKKPRVALSGEEFKRLTPRDFKRFGIQAEEADNWEVVKRWPSGIARHLREKKPSLPVEGRGR